MAEVNVEIVDDEKKPEEIPVEEVVEVAEDAVEEAVAEANDNAAEAVVDAITEGDAIQRDIDAASDVGYALGLLEGIDKRVTVLETANVIEEISEPEPIVIPMPESIGEDEEAETDDVPTTQKTHWFFRSAKDWKK